MDIKHLIFIVNMKKKYVKECIVVFYRITQRKLAVFLRELSYLLNLMPVAHHIDSAKFGEMIAFYALAPNGGIIQ